MAAGQILPAGNEAVSVLPWNFPEYPFGGTQVQLPKQPIHRIRLVLLFPLNSGFSWVLATGTWGFPSWVFFLPWRREILIRDTIHWILALCQETVPTPPTQFTPCLPWDAVNEATESQRSSILCWTWHRQETTIPLQNSGLWLSKLTLSPIPSYLHFLFFHFIKKKFSSLFLSHLLETNEKQLIIIALPLWIKKI